MEEKNSIAYSGVLHRKHQSFLPAGNMSRITLDTIVLGIQRLPIPNKQRPLGCVLQKQTKKLS
jgi:hypothetical protein